MANSFDADMAHQRMAMPLTIRPSVPLQSAKRFRKSVHRINEELRQNKDETRREEKSKASEGKINKQCICMRPECKGRGRGRDSTGKGMWVVEQMSECLPYKKIVSVCICTCVCACV